MDPTLLSLVPRHTICLGQILAEMSLWICIPNIVDMNTELEYFPPKGAGFVRREWRVLLRILFGSFWSIDAYLKWVFVLDGRNLIDVMNDATGGQPQPVQKWIHFWAGTASSLPNFTLLIAIFETVVAILLFLGFLVPSISILGIAFNILIWSTAEGFGGIFLSGATDIGVGPLYAAIFAGLIVIQAGRQKGLDKILHQKLPRLPFW